jgi:hypothetical protein
MDSFQWRGEFVCEIYDVDGTYLRTVKATNGITDAGLANVVSVEFAAGTQITAWFAGLIDLASFSALANADTMASHAGWIENTNYSESVRQTWSAVASGPTVTNSAAMVFTINATVTIKGAFIVSNSTKGGTTGTLWATALFDVGDQQLISGQTLKIYYLGNAARA